MAAPDLATVFVFVGFVLAAYSIVANDAVQTLGTFLSSNSHRPWWMLWLFASAILVVVVVYGWSVNLGDAAYGRLDKFPEPPGGITWIHAIPPVFILILTRYGIPVSTTFLILTVFAPSNLGQVLIKSALGYGVAFIVGIAVFVLISQTVEKRFLNTSSAKPGWHWVALQWGATGFLWSQWLIQDLANIFVYLPRTLRLDILLLALVLMLALHALIFAKRGGKIQNIVLTKTNTLDIRSATLIDLIFGFVLLYFKELSNVPMSTTWVFLGLLAGREIALSFMLRHRTIAHAFSLAGKDMSKALLGLGISIGLAFGLPLLDKAIFGKGAEPTLAVANPSPKQMAETR